MEQVPRHHCLVYEGSAARHLPVLAAAMCTHLRQNHRCLYLNSPEMVTAMRLYLEANALDVTAEMKRGALALSSEQKLRGGKFDADAMLRGLQESLQQALDDGFKGLWASGDIAWEFGPARDFSALADYERRLDAFFAEHPELIGVCQYHADALPREAMRQGLLAHPSVFINEKMALINPHFLDPHLTQAQGQSSANDAKSRADANSGESGLDSSLDRLLQLEFAI